MNQKLTIITINYNNLEGLRRTVESVINQTWQEFEYIIIDGGSTDGSATYIESQSEHFDYWVSEPDKGIYNAMNKGVAKATGEYLLFLNSGDHLYSNSVIEKNVHQIEKYDLIYFNWQVIGDKFSNIVAFPEKLRFSFMFFGYLPHPSTFIKKELFDTVGLYDENLKIVSDWKFMMLALFIHRCSYKQINETVSTFYLGGISSITDFSNERNLVLNEYFSEYVLDYSLFLDSDNKRKILETNRFRMLSEIEKSYLGRKIVSVFFRIYIILFSKKKIKDILN